MNYDELIWFDWTTYKRPHNFIDRTGQENEHFKVIGRAPNKGTTTMWNCLCKHCGMYCVKNTTNLNKHNSCGCTRYTTVSNKLSKDITGQTFGQLTALYRNGKNSITRNSIWHCRCVCGNEIDVDSNNLTTLHTTSCGCIKQEKSIGMLNIKKILTENNIIYKTEISFSDLLGEKNHPYFYDCGIYQNDKLIRLIEYDGIQHYKETWGKWATRDNLENRQSRDKEKDKYALFHNIPLVRIPYWERDNITLEMLMSDKYLVKQ